ncbi:uncharacterized protein LOC141641493 [Silene latifolia]|uniref:uncharacterized protein LOC141641493 n=1 Tax=Silene latifolia TaxID=37657 RepID=UPI003D78377B
MAVDLLSDTSSSRGISPRISFSHDLKNCEIVPIEPHTPLKTSLLDYDFDFCVSKRRCDQDSTLADELFANGVILPIQIKRKNIPFVTKSKSSSSSSSSSFLPPLPPLKNNNEGDHTKETEQKQSNNNNTTNNEDSKSFWKFKRSKSLNCGRIYRRGLCSLPLLSRSKSTGSTTSAKRSLISKDEASVNHHYNHHHNGKQASLKNSSLSNHQKPPLKKNYGGGSSFNSGLIQVNPIINVPTASLFGLASFFSNGGSKDKGKKK